MNSAFTIETLITDDQASQAFPLVQASNPGLELKRWLEFVRFYTSEEHKNQAGVSAIRDDQNCFCGVFAYQVGRELNVGAIFSIQLFIASDVLNSLLTVRGLIQAAEALARKLDCAAVQICVPNDQSRMLGRLQELGLPNAACLFWRMGERKAAS
jgi:hypothetical protein